MTAPDALADVRRRIDAIDRRMVALIAERQACVVQAGSLKADAAAVRAPARVEQVIARVRALAVEQGASPDVVEATYRALIGAFISLELDVHRGAAAETGAAGSGAATVAAENPELLLQRALSSAERGEAALATSELIRLLDTASDLSLRLRAAVVLGELLIASNRSAEAELVLATAASGAEAAEDLDDVDAAELERVRDLLDHVRR
ncbi:chorismate mutase [Leucobacter chromiiresistens]|uniref:chorismate mutase n=1 Tax=Leucobacter chromiiresistens TaxID=1079994 RepID=UPI0009E9FBC2|nr:chorismate mutase [Leucobacter chromiiresistens]